MTTFKKFLSEASSSSALVNVTKFTLDTLIECYKNAGYEVPANEVRFFKASKYVKYISKNHSHQFVVMMEDDGNSDEFYISNFYVELNSEGKLVAEPGGTPSFSGTEEEVRKAFAKY